MLERCALLAGQYQPALFGACQCAFAVLLTNAMPFPLRHQLRRLLKPLFGLDHLARCEAVVAAPVLAQCNKIG